MRFTPARLVTFVVATSFAVLPLAGGGCGTTTDTKVSRAAVEALPSWHATAARQRLTEFVERTSTPGSPDFVPEPERVAVFDNDGTLWSEQPAYVQLAFVVDRIRVMAPQHPEWRTTEPYASVLRGDVQGVAAGGHDALIELLLATHAGMTTDEFDVIAREWIATARHPRTGRPYTEMVYQPMLELLDYLRANGYRTWIVSGGGIDFMRPWTEAVYGIPPEQVVGSMMGLEYETDASAPRIRRTADDLFIDDKEGKPVGIQRAIGRRPVMAFGNSDGDFEMLEWTTTGSGPRLGVYIHHTDAVRETAYDRESSIGRLDRGLDEAPRRGWLVVDMKRDWARVFPGDE